jgi:hypothetical protein
MAFNLYLSIFSAGLLASLPTAANVDNPKIARQFYATDTNATYVWNPVTVAWELQAQLKPTTVALLPTTNLIAGSSCVVSDATTPAVGATVVGAGAVQCSVIWNGAAWKVG